MRRVRYRVAMSLDGFIAGPHGELDWLVPGSTGELQTFFSEIDTVLLGRRTFELTRQPGAPQFPREWRQYVFSRTLSADIHPDVMIVAIDAARVVASLRAASGRDIWLFGGAELFRGLAAHGQVDTVEVVVVPVLLGTGIQLVGEGSGRIPLRLVAAKSDPKGVVSLRYDIASRAV
jgi:dihydrofolate reductase